jgi:uncharacterized protein
MAMKDKPADPRALELRSACAEGAVLEGRWPLALFARLVPGLSEPPGDAPVAWRAQAEQRRVAGGEPERWLHLQAHATVPLQCQRCLATMAQTVELDRRFRFVPGEEEAERLDEASDDDVLALPARLDLRELLEDELILALPIVPRHEGECPDPLRQPAESAGAAASAGERPHPFAALAALRKPG